MARRRGHFFPPDNVTLGEWRYLMARYAPNGIVRNAFMVFGAWNVPSNTDSRTANVPMSRSSADHRNANSSPMRSPPEGHHV